MSSEATAGQTPDIYGQVHPVETPELIMRSQKVFQDELEKIPLTEKTNLIKAQQLCPELLTEEFQLFFLRAEVFNADLAALRYVRYWDQRVERFGLERAFRPLAIQATLGNNNDDDTRALQLGLIRLSPVRDPMGRAILFFDGSQMDSTKYTRDSMIRVLWYLIHTALYEHETVQKHGVIMIADPRHVSSFYKIDTELLKQLMASIKGCIPIRMAGAHVCYPPFYYGMLFQFLKYFMAERMKKRVQCHYGTEDQVFQSLAKYGLTQERLPKTLGGYVVL